MKGLNSRHFDSKVKSLAKYAENIYLMAIWQQNVIQPLRNFQYNRDKRMMRGESRHV